MLVWGWVVFFKDKDTFRERGRGWEMSFLRSYQKSASTEMTLTELTPTLRSILELFFEISGQL